MHPVVILSDKTAVTPKKHTKKHRSRSVSAPSSVTNTSPCWVGFIVPGSTIRYGSSFWIVTFRPRPSSRQAMEADARPFPSDDTTPPVTKMYFVCFGPRGGGAFIENPPRKWWTRPRAHARAHSACTPKAAYRPEKRTGRLRFL